MLGVEARTMAMTGKRHALSDPHELTQWQGFIRLEYIEINMA